MWVKCAAVVSLLALAACGGNPWGSDDGGTTPEGTPLVSAEVTKNVAAADLKGWRAGDATFRIRMTAQDATDLDATYARNPALDVGPYQAYTYQATSSNRMVVALVGGTDTLKAVAAMEAGQFADSHSGGQAYRADVFIAPTGGVGEPFDYSGTYAGLLNWGEETPGGPGGTLNPTRAYRTTGRVLITADFTEMSVSGGVDQRSIVDIGEALPDLALRKTGITADGTFDGEVQRLGGTDFVSAGEYAGAFAGLDASQVAVLLVLNPNGRANAVEQGLIVLPSCTTGGGPACP